MIKEKFTLWASISKKLGRLFGHLPFSPNTYSYSVLPVVLLGFIFVMMHHILIGVILFILAGFVDLVDGAVAREKNQCTSGGAFLDGSLDRFVDFLLLFSYFCVPLITPLLPTSEWIALAVFLVLMPTFEVAYANHRKAVNDPDEKIIWRLLNRAEMYVLMLAIPFVSMYSPRFAGYLLALLVILSFITTIQTIVKTLRLSAKAQKPLENDNSTKVVALDDTTAPDDVTA